MLFDIIFLLQHYVFYRAAWDKKEIDKIDGDGAFDRKMVEKQ